MNTVFIVLPMNKDLYNIGDVNAIFSSTSFDDAVQYGLCCKIGEYYPFYIAEIELDNPVSAPKCGYSKAFPISLVGKCDMSSINQWYNYENPGETRTVGRELKIYNKKGE